MKGKRFRFRAACCPATAFTPIPGASGHSAHATVNRKEPFQGDGVRPARPPSLERSISSAGRIVNLITHFHHFYPRTGESLSFRGGPSYGLSLTLGIPHICQALSLPGSVPSGCRHAGNRGHEKARAFPNHRFFAIVFHLWHARLPGQGIRFFRQASMSRGLTTN